MLKNKEMEKITLTLNTSDTVKKKLFLQMLTLFDFIEIETNAQFLKRFVRNTPKNVILTEEDIINEIMEMRYGKD